MNQRDEIGNCGTCTFDTTTGNLCGHPRTIEREFWNTPTCEGWQQRDSSTALVLPMLESGATCGESAGGSGDAAIAGTSTQ